MFTDNDLISITNHTSCEVISPDSCRFVKCVLKVPYDKQCIDAVHKVDYLLYPKYYRCPIFQKFNILVNEHYEVFRIYDVFIDHENNFYYIIIVFHDDVDDYIEKKNFFKNSKEVDWFVLDEENNQIYTANSFIDNVH